MGKKCVRQIKGRNTAMDDCAIKIDETGRIS
jgi:hypothetical protein